MSMNHEPFYRIPYPPACHLLALAGLYRRSVWRGIVGAMERVAMRHTLITFAVIAALIVAAVIVRALVLAGYGWLSITPSSAWAALPAVALLLAFCAGFIARERAR